MERACVRILTPRNFRTPLEAPRNSGANLFRNAHDHADLATGSQGFNPKRGILLRPHPITSACPPLQTPKPMSVLAISDLLCHNPMHSAPHPSRTPSHCPLDPPDFRSGTSPPCPFVLLAIGRVPMTHKARFCYCFFVP